MVFILLVLGVTFGSFVNALVWRLRQQELHPKSRQKYSISTGRSMCSRCKEPLAVKDLIPVISWIWLQGKCRYCHKPIEDTPLPEIVTAILFVISYIFWPNRINGTEIVLFGAWLSLLVGFVALGLYDFKWTLLPNRILFWMIPAVILQNVVLLATSSDKGTLCINLLISILVGGGVFWLLFQVSEGKWIGGGDVKLGFLVGAILGSPLLSFLWIFVASLLGTFVSLPQLLLGNSKIKSRIPFGPYLIASVIVVKLFGKQMVHWYFNQLGL